MILLSLSLAADREPVGVGAGVLVGIPTGIRLWAGCDGTAAARAASETATVCSGSTAGVFAAVSCAEAGSCAAPTDGPSASRLAAAARSSRASSSPSW